MIQLRIGLLFADSPVLRTGIMLKALLREACRLEDDPIFTEIIAIRFFLNNAVTALNLCETWTLEQFKNLTEVIKKQKRQAASDLPPFSQPFITGAFSVM